MAIYTKPHQVTVAVDLDGTLATYHTFNDAIGPPRPGAKRLMSLLKENGYRVIVWTCRGDDDAVREWLERHQIPYDEINANVDQPEDTSAKIVADVYLDDRAVDASGDLMEALATVLEKASAVQYGMFYPESTGGWITQESRHWKPQKYQEHEPGMGPDPSEWVQHTTRKGRSGWRNVTTGEFREQETRPGEQKPGKPEPPPSMEPPKAPVEEPLELAPEPERPESEPKPPEPKPEEERAIGVEPVETPPEEEPVEAEVVEAGPLDAREVHKQLEQMPAGTTLAGWQKVASKRFGVPVWVRGSDARDDSQLAAEFAAGKIDPRELRKGRERPEEGNGEEPEAPQLTDEQQKSVRGVAAAFGIQPGDLFNNRRTRNFLNRTARGLGFDPESAGKQPHEQAMASAQFLDGQRQHLEAVVDMAKAHEWRGGTAKELAARARGAGNHLVNRAVQMGYEPHPDHDDQQRLAGSIQFLRGYESRRPPDQQPVSDILKQFLKLPRGRITAWHIAGAVIGFWMMYRYLNRSRSRR